MWYLTYKCSHGTAHDFIWKLKDVVWNCGANKELCHLIAEVVAVMTEKVVSLSCVAFADLLQVLLKDFLRNMCHPQFHNSDWSSIGSLSSWVLLNASWEIVFLSIDYQTSVPVISHIARWKVEWIWLHYNEAEISSILVSQISTEPLQLISNKSVITVSLVPKLTLSINI